MDNDTLAYNIFYNVALKNLELDPFANVCFGIVTSEKLAVEIGVKTLPHVKLVLWNDTLVFFLYCLCKAFLMNMYIIHLISF